MKSFDDHDYPEFNEFESRPQYFCGICDTQMNEEFDVNYPGKRWLHCPECSKDIDRLETLETELATCRERLVEARTIYYDLQDQIKRMTR